MKYELKGGFSSAAPLSNKFDVSPFWGKASTPLFKKALREAYPPKRGNVQRARGQRWHLHTILTFLIFILTTALLAQTTPSNLRHLTTIPQKAKNFTTDKLHQVYLITEDNELIKYSDKGEVLFRYNNNTLGEIACIDAVDPFNILLFYPDHQLAVRLDRTLSSTQEYYLFDAGIYNVSTIALSEDNNIWVYDASNFQLKKVGPNGNVLVESGDLSMTLLQLPEVKQIIYGGSKVFLNAPVTGILVFNSFGQYQKTLPTPNVGALQILGDKLICQSGENLFSLDLGIGFETPIVLPIQLQEGDQVRIHNDRLFIFKAEGVEIYAF